MIRPSDHFVNSVAANVAYWSERTRTLDRDGIREVDRERQNLFRAADFGLRLEETWADSTELVLQSYTLIDEKGYARDWVTLLERIIDSCPPNEPILKGRVLGQLGILYRRTRQLDKALNAHFEEEKIGIHTGDEKRISLARMHLAFVYFRLRQYDEGKKQAQAALASFRVNAPGSEMVAKSLNAAGLIASNLGDLETAERRFLEAVDHYRRLDLQLELGRALLNLGNVLRDANRYDEAIEHYHEARTILIAVGNRIDQMRLDMSLGTLLYYQGKPAEAEEVFRRADSPYVRQWATTYEIAQIKMNLANVLLAQEKFAESERYWRECIPEWRQAGAQLMLANSLGGLAETLVAKGDIDQAISLFDEALNIVGLYPDDAWARKVGRGLSEELAKALIVKEGGGHPVRNE